MAKTEDGGCTWKQIWRNPLQPDETMSDIFFLNEREGWLSGAYLGSLFRTRDGGKTWSQMKLPRGSRPAAA